MKNKILPFIATTMNTLKKQGPAHLVALGRLDWGKLTKQPMMPVILGLLYLLTPQWLQTVTVLVIVVTVAVRRYEEENQTI